MRIFAPDYPRNEHGWIVFPSDMAWRKRLFPEGVFKHYAKMHLFLCQEIISYVSKLGDTILDPMAGTGTIMLAATMGRNVICIDIEEGYHKIQCEVKATLEHEFPNMGHTILLHGNCKLILPIPCNHIIFSPPYANILKPSKSPSKFVTEKYRLDDNQYQMYAQTTGNVGLRNTFLYNQDMEKVYRLCYESLAPGGTMTVVIKDRIVDGVRVYLSKWVERVCTRIGFVNLEWYRHRMMGGAYQDVARSKGMETVDEEDIMVFRK